MPILQDVTSGPPQTLEAKQAKTTELMRNLIQMAFQQNSRFNQQGMRLVWKNPYGLSPAEVFEGFGRLGAEIMLAARSQVAMLNANAPGAINDETPLPLAVDETTGVVTVVVPEPEPAPEPEP